MIPKRRMGIISEVKNLLNTEEVMFQITRRSKSKSGLYQRFSNMTELKCSNCGGDIGTTGLLSPTLEKRDDTSV